MNLVKLNSIFNVDRGSRSKQHFNKMEECDRYHEDSVPYISRKGVDNGQKAYVIKSKDINPAEGNCLTVAVSGSVLSTHYQPGEFYNGQDLFILRPVRSMSVEEFFYYAMCIEKNRFKYNYGRQANATLHEIMIPDRMDSLFNDIYSDTINKFKNIV